MQIKSVSKEMLLKLSCTDFSEQIIEAKRWNYQDMINKGAASYKTLKEKKHENRNNSTTPIAVVVEPVEVLVDENGDVVKGPAVKRAKKHYHTRF